MNLILLHDDDLLPSDEGTAQLTDARRVGHIHKVLRAAPGDHLVVGRLGGNTGTAEVIALSPQAVTLRLGALRTPPPPRLPVLLVLALPRPKVVRRALSDLATLGVERIVLLNAARVEKSFWSSPLLAEAAIARALHLGLEQGRDTVPPEVLLRRRFRPFVEDELPALAAGRRCLVAHPYADAALSASPGPTALAVGPEGGWVDFELALLQSAAGFLPVSLGPRVLRTETALPYLLGAMGHVQNCHMDASIL